MALLRLQRRNRAVELVYYTVEYVTIALVGHDYPGRLMRLLYRAPVWLYRSGLGWLVGGTTLLLTTTGRKTGQHRFTALGYNYDETSDTYYVTSGWPARSDWYRNALAHPRVEVRVGKRRFSADAKRVSEAVSIEIIREYRRRNPFARRVWTVLLGRTFDDSEAALRDLVAKQPTLALRAALTPARPERNRGGWAG